MKFHRSPQARARRLFLALLVLPLLGLMPPMAEAEPKEDADPALPAPATRVIAKFSEFERTGPTRAQWETKQRDVLRYLERLFNEETARANLEGSLALRDLARRIRALPYPADRLGASLAGIPEESP